MEVIITKRTREGRDLTGQRFGRLVVIAPAEPKRVGKNIRYYWECRCDCGNTKIIREDGLLSPTRPAQSCGCLQKDRVREYFNTHQVPIKHGHSYEPLFNTWYLIKYRCENPSCKAFHNYGGRGITVCDEWSNGSTGYENFRDWALSHGYEKGLTIDRIDNDAGYSPDNCRWVDNMTQANNKRDNHFVTYNGETKTIAEWARVIGMDYKVLHSRFQNGWDAERALTQPLRKWPTKHKDNGAA